VGPSVASGRVLNFHLYLQLAWRGAVSGCQSIIAGFVLMAALRDLKRAGDLLTKKPRCDI
jgi:hypothetical protein